MTKTFLIVTGKVFENDDPFILKALVITHECEKKGASK